MSMKVKFKNPLLFSDNCDILCKIFSNAGENVCIRLKTVFFLF